MNCDRNNQINAFPMYPVYGGYIENPNMMSNIPNSVVYPNANFENRIINLENRVSRLENILSNNNNNNSCGCNKNFNDNNYIV